ncbi:recombinase family protein [Myxococcota bacterium]
MTRRKAKEVDPRKVVAYIRVSTDEQAVEGISLDAQQASIGAYCTLRNLELVDLVADPGVSGAKPLARRAGGQRVLELIKDRLVGGVVAVKLDRVFRSAVDCLGTVENWDKDEVAFHLLDFGGTSIDTSTAIGKMFLTMAAGFAEFERNLTAERTSAALQRKIERRERVGRVPFGYRTAEDGVTLEEDPAEQAVLARIRRLRADGMTFQGIVDLLNDEQVPPPKAKRGGKQGTRWHLATVHYLLNQAEFQAG